MTATVNGSPIIDAAIRMPAVGAWHADVGATTDTALTGAVTLLAEGVSFAGTVLRSGMSGTRSKAKIVGGKAGLSKELAAKLYLGPTVGQVVTDLAREAGETLSAAADASVTTFRLPKWERAQGTAGHALTAVLAAAGAVWRVLRDGTIWYGPQTWPAADVQHRLIDEDWTSGVIEIAPDAPDLLPATTFRSQRIEHVVHRIGPSSLRTEAWIIRAGGSLERFLGGILRKIDYSRAYRCRVVSQHNDGRLELMPDDDAIRGAGLDFVPIKHGLPGVTVKVPAGVFVNVAFDDGDPSKPFAALFEPGSVTEVQFDGGTKSVARVDDTLQTELFFQFAPGSGGAVGVLFVRAPGATTWTSVATAPIAPLPATTGTQCVGKIIAGNDKLKA